MKFRLKHFVFMAVAALVGVVGVSVIGRVSAGDGSAASQHAPTPRATTALVKRESVSTRLTVAGEFIPYQEVEIHAKVAGYIKKIYVDIGDRVKAGAVLAELEVPELTAQVEGAEAAVRHGREEITRAENEVSRAQANHAALHSASVRLQEAAAARPGLVAQQEIDDSVAKDKSSEAQIDAAKAALAAAQQQLEVAKATRAQYAAMIAYSRITAPFSGVVTWRYADTGALVQAGTSNASAQPVVKLAQVDVLRLRVPVPEVFSALIRNGSAAEITVQATGEHLAGKVVRVTDSLERSTRTMQAEIDVPNDGKGLSPGMYADVVLQVHRKPDALTVPVEAVRRDTDGSSVLALDAQNRVVLRRIQTGIQEPSRVEVVSGLIEGERVIVGNLNSYQPGEVVDPKPSALAEAPLTTGGEQ